MKRKTTEDVSKLNGGSSGDELDVEGITDKAIKKMKNTVPKFEVNYLLGKDGIEKVVKEFPKIKFRGKGHEVGLWLWYYSTCLPVVSFPFVLLGM